MAGSILNNHLKFEKRGTALQHLSDDQIVDLMTDYYFSFEKVSYLLNKYLIKNTPPGRLFLLFPHIETDKICSECGKRIHLLFAAKTTDYLCTDFFTCGYCTLKFKMDHNEFENYHVLINQYFIDKQKSKQKKLLDVVKSVSAYIELNTPTEINEDELSPLDRFYLAALLRIALDESVQFIKPLNKFLKKLAPTEDFQHSIVNHLIESNLLVLYSKNIDLKLFDLVFDNKNNLQEVSANYFNVCLKINVRPVDDNYERLFKELMYPDSKYFDNDFCFKMWKQIAASECVQYLVQRMNRVGYNFSPGLKTFNLIDFLLENFSVSQVFGIIYRAVAFSTAQYQAGKINIFQAKNMVIGTCQRHGETAISNNWKLTSYRRDYELPQTSVSEVLFNAIMKISVLGFSEVPTKEF